MMYDQFDHGSGTDIWGFAFMILMMTLVFLGIILVVRYLHNSNPGSVKVNSALDILKNRYAKGEIDKKEFEEKSKDLKS
ncbi:MAG: SHOCT domain-containing protein [Candidatus Saccharibacteria bacterium]